VNFQIYQALLLSFIVNSALAQTKYEYYHFDINGVDKANKTFLVVAKNQLTFCFVAGYRERYYDSVADGKKITILGTEESEECTSSYGPYTFRKKDQAIFVDYYDALNRKVKSHKQYSLKKKDTTDYFYLFSGPHYESATIDGSAFYERDSVIRGANSEKYGCYVFREEQLGAIDLRSPAIRRIYIDKKSLMPVRYEIYDKKGNMKAYYQIKGAMNAK